ncbi:MAG: hypothetical protein ACOH2F_08315 [Cellulomonas sp.]
MEDIQAWTVRWSDLWAMLAATGTLLAVAVAVWVAARESRSRRSAEERATAAEHDRDEERTRSDHRRATEREERRLEQARQVISWVEHRPAQRDRAHFDSTGERLRNEHVLCFVNHSNAPMFNVRVRVYWQATNTDAGVADIAVLPAGGATHERVLAEELQERGFDASGLIYFRDLNGICWRRWESGFLHELDEHGREVAEQR